MEKEEYARNINHFLNKLTKEFVKKAKTKVHLEGVILTGSFASWIKTKGAHEPSWGGIPDVNYYPLVRGKEEEIVIAEEILQQSISKIIDSFKKKGLRYNILLDLHPFSISNYLPVFDKDIINLQLTTRMINLALTERYPRYSWHGWIGKYLREVKRDKIWLKYMYLGMLSYGNILQILPLYTRDREHLFDESYRYLKEILKDGASLALTNEESEKGELYKILGNWRNRITPLYRERYGKEAANISILTKKIDENYILYRKTFKNPMKLIKMGIKLRSIVFEKGFKKRMKEIVGEKGDIPEIFEELPLWW
jgi:hypothetical protein